MYGSYHEMKFDCLGLTLRLEAMVNVLFEGLIRDIDLTLITKATFGQIHQTLQRFDQALRLDGIRSAEFERQLEFLGDSLAVKGFTLTQYLDIFKGFAQAVQNIIKDHFNNLHGANLNRILPQLSTDRILPKYLPREPLEDRERLNHRMAEIFFRDQIAGALGLQQLDLFLGRILNTLFQQSYKLPQDKLRQLLLYDPHTSLVAIDSPHSREIGVIHLGTKGFNLVKLNSLGFRVPPGFIVTTEVFRCREVIESYAPAQRNFHEQITHHLQRLEQAAGKTFGDPANPLLLSVRSGSSISQPGMMDTLLDVGNNLAITAGVAARTGNAWFAWDNYRRFLQNYGMAHDMTRDDFDAVIAEFKQRLGIPLKRHFSGDQMREVALAYRRLIEEAGIEVIDSPIEQLLLAIRRVLASWESPKALAYRRIMGISDDWGTAIAIQAMVYGNLSSEAGHRGGFHPQPALVRGRAEAVGGLHHRQPGGGRGVRAGAHHAHLALPAGHRNARDRRHPGDALPRDLPRAEALGPRADRRPRLEPPGDRVHLRKPVGRRPLHAANPGHGHSRKPEGVDLRFRGAAPATGCWGTASASAGAP